MKFLASFKFAIILIFFSAVLVIAGTFLESSHDSHRIAEDWIYHHPIFQILLLGYFVNILLSALSRYPFKKRHIPFLITHLGLLMIILGVFIKTTFGVQGHMQLIEGTASDDLIHPNKPALYVENRWGHSQSIPIDAVNVLEYHAHAEEKYDFWNEELSPFKVTKDSDGMTTVSSKNIHGEEVAIAYSPNKLEEWIAYDKGFLGYTVQAELPFIKDEDKKAYDSAIDEYLIQDLRGKRMLSKPLEVMQEASSLIDFPKALIHYLKAWADQDTWLYEIPFPGSINWKNVQEYRTLYWIAELFNESHFLENLKENGWPLLQSLTNIQDKQEQFETWMNQIYSVQDQLPNPPEQLDPIQEARMLSAYLRLYSIHYNKIPKPILPFEENFITVESPLSHLIIPKDLPLKPEDARPAIVIGFNNEKISLVYDPLKTGLKWPSRDGTYLFKFQPHIEKLPYSIRVHHANDIKYPGSDQTVSYECTLSIKDKKSGSTTPCMLQMNHVYETDDGYRFYLAGIGKVDSYGVRSLQLVVNRDPAKMILTYPGALLVAFGILSLFFGKKIFNPRSHD